MKERKRRISSYLMVHNPVGYKIFNDLCEIIKRDIENSSLYMEENYEFCRKGKTKVNIDGFGDYNVEYKMYISHNVYNEALKFVEVNHKNKTIKISDIIDPELSCRDRLVRIFEALFNYQISVNKAFTNEYSDFLNDLYEYFDITFQNNECKNVNDRLNGDSKECINENKEYLKFDSLVKTYYHLMSEKKLNDEIIEGYFGVPREFFEIVLKNIENSFWFKLCYILRKNYTPPFSVNFKCLSEKDYSNLLNIEYAPFDDFAIN